jgi:NAD(P)H-flavin reductase
MLATGERWGGGAGERPYLPRAFSFARAKPDLAGGVELQFLLEDVGPGTHRLGELEATEALALLGPLGRGFEQPPEGTGAVLVGGGIGTAPLLCWDDELRAAGHDPALLLGFRSAAHAEAASLFDGDAVLTTDDGSAGRPGLVTEPLRELLSAEPDQVVYACGPPGMLAAVRDLCAELGVPARLALEAGMACGYGACFGCVVETVDGYERVCVDGPVFDGSRLLGVGHA